MSEHDKLKRMELADGLGFAIDALISATAGVGGQINAGDAVQRLVADFPSTELSPAELAVAVMRAAAEKGVAVTIDSRVESLGPERRQSELG